MPSNEDIEQSNLSPEEDAGRQDTFNPEPAPVPSSRLNWLASPSWPGAKSHSDGISDLFEAPDQEEIDDDMADLTEVDVERDIIDADEETGDLSDLVDVSEADIMGFEGSEQFAQKPRYRVAPALRRPTRYTPPTSLSNVGG